MNEADGETEESSPQPNRFANRISQVAEQGQRVFFEVGRTLGRTAASASELLSDAELRRHDLVSDAKLRHVVYCFVQEGTYSVGA